MRIGNPRDLEGGGVEARIEGGRAFLETMLSCPVAVTDKPRGYLPEFETTHSLMADRQPALNAAWLTDFVQAADRQIVYELTEPLGTTITLFWAGEQLVLIGPYTAGPVKSAEAEALLGSLGIPGAQLQPYLLWRSRFAIVESEYVMRGATALLHHTGHRTTELGFERVPTTTTVIAPGSAEPIHSAPFDAIERRYAAEEEFMQAIAEGDERRALATLHAMAAETQKPSYLTTPYLGATILRIMTRVAAQRSGLPPVTIDALSQTAAQRLHRSAHTNDVTSVTPAIVAMVSEFCIHIRRYRQRPYSGLVRQIIDEIELHLSHNVSPTDLAHRLGVSESHLARRFKTETGRTISGYVAVERANRAARLLATTAQPVQDIAAYVGYLDANYFVKVFKSVHGVTPSTYRRQHAF